MMKKTCRVPYLCGGPPGLLKIFLGVEAVTGVVSCCVSVIALTVLMFRGQWTGILFVPPMVYSAYLGIQVFSGANKLFRGDGAGADTIDSACRGRRALIWIVFALSALVSLVTSMSARRAAAAGILGTLLGIALSALMILPFHFYYKNVERIIGGYVGREVSSGSSVGLSHPEGHLSLQCALFALIEMADVFAIRLARIDSSLVSRYSPLISIALYLSAARFLMVNICYRGFIRSHSGPAKDGEAVFSPSGYGDSAVLCVAGSVFFGWEAVNELIIFIRNLSWGVYKSPLPGILAFIAVAALCLLGLALSRRPGRAALVAAGAFILVCMNAAGSFSNPANFADPESAAYFIGRILSILFWGTAAAAACFRLRGKPGAGALRSVLIVLAALYFATCIPGYVLNARAYMAYWHALVYNLLGDAMYFVALLALAGAIAGPEKASEENGGGRKELLPDSQERKDA